MVNKMTTIINPYDIDRTQHKQYDGLTFIECRLLDKRQAEEQEAEEQRIKASDRNDWQAICVKAGFSLDAHEMLRPNSADRGVSRAAVGAGVTSIAAPKAGAVVIRQVKDGFQLSDEEWDIVAPCVPTNKYVKEMTARERLFLDGILWSVEAIALGLSWNYFPPELGNAKSLQERMRKWYQARSFNALYDRLIITHGLSDARMEAFETIANNEVEANRTATMRKHKKAVV
jgi:transposase